MTMAPGATADVNDLLLEHNGDGTHKAPPLDTPGTIKMWPSRFVETGWLFCDGTAISRATYANLFAALVHAVGVATVSIAAPCVVTLVGHGFQEGDSFYFTTTGALPTGVAANTLYYIISAGLTANAFEFSATRGGAAVGSSGSQSGVHTVHDCPWGLGDGATTFNKPDLRGRVPVGMGANTDTTLGHTDGVAIGSRTPVHLHTGPVHTHPGVIVNNTVNFSGAYVSADGTFLRVSTGSGAGPALGPGVAANAAGSTGNANPAFGVVNFEIKT